MKKITLIFLLTFIAITFSFSQTFEDLIQLDSIAFSDVAFADVNGDNHQDFLITGQDGNYNLIAKLYINDGNGNFTVLNNTPFQGIVNGEIAFADVNGDNAVDVLFGGQTNTAQLSTKLYLNDGNGNFTLVPNTPFTAINIGSIAFADVNGDNTQDVVISGQNDPFFGRTTELYTNDGNGNFTLVTGTPFSNVWQSSIAFADVNGDNTQDLLVTGQSNSQFTAEIYTNDGNGNFTLMTGTPFDGVRYSSTAFADVNGDGAIDVLITGISANQQLTAKLYLNDGNGNFTLAQGTPFDAVYLGEIAFADVDLDNDIDVLISGNGSLQNVPNL